MTPAIIGTRSSALAVAQTRLVMAELKRSWPGRNFEIRTIKTKGDELAENPAAGRDLNKGLFTAELEKALLADDIDIAVHSLKDMPTDETSGLALGAITKRAGAHDVLITRGPQSLRELPTYAVIATGSPRRAAQLNLFRRDLRPEDIRGNIDTRIRKFRENVEWAGLILAAAGLERLKPDLQNLVATPLPFETMLPAPGQGALAVQTRENDKDVLQLLQPLHDTRTSACVTAERMFLHALGGGCDEPIAAYAEITEDNLLRLDGIAWLVGEQEPRRGQLIRRIDQPEVLGVDLAVELSR
ncbi:MAG TPA: hydroxymethylbilane synthase [Candidatus Methylacidiphilales bacterium]|nr:hydroxymethylbilane synthase [Candidatus Methylacidiphilales bacterium]